MDGITFDSEAEARRYSELVLLVKANEIRDLERQVRIPLMVNGVKCGTSIIDHGYTVVSDGRKVLEDVKGHTGPGAVTSLWQLKFKIVEALTGIPVEIVK